MSSDYPASSWTLTYNLRGPSKIDITASADGDYFEISVPASTTANYKVGDYWWAAFVTKGAERYQIDSGTLEIKQNLAESLTTYDGRSHVKKVLDAIEAAILGRATRTQLALTIGGKAISMWTPEQLLAFRDRYKTEYLAEVKAEKIANNEATGGKILIRFKKA